jgi:hypothetical protein
MLSTQLPATQGEYAVTAFDRGDVIHNGDVIYTNPTRKGYHALFNAQGGGTAHVGPFETAKEAYSVGLGFADFKQVIQIN